MLFPRKLRAPIDTRDTRKDVLEYSALIIDSPSATTRSAADGAQVGVVVRHLLTEVGPGLLEL